MKTSQEIDEEVASIVFGHKLWTVDEMQAEADKAWKDQPNCRVFLMGFEARQLSFGGFGFKNTVKPYSTSIEAAWDVVERVQGEWCDFTLEASGLCQWTATSPVSTATARTPAMAICLCGIQAFKALREMREKTKA